MPEAHGQLDERAARIKKTSQWLGATPMTDFGEIVTEDTGEFEMSAQVIHTTVQQIRIALRVGHGTVRIGERHRPTCEAIAQLLTSEERRRVIFDLDNIMPPEVDELADMRAGPIGSGRDIIRPCDPAVVRLEDGSLRPS